VWAAERKKERREKYKKKEEMKMEKENWNFLALFAPSRMVASGQIS
jgi:hypothetical protein